MARDFSEDSRVKIPAIVHLTRLGYEYISVKLHKSEIDQKTNIFKEQFRKAISKINNRSFSTDEIDNLLWEIYLKIDTEDLGENFYNCLQNGINGINLIDFENPDSNLFQVCTELSYETDDENFRPDVIPLLNGMPLSFIEVKIPNNRKGMLEEKDRINARFRNVKNKHFANLTQFMIFSNNMEYDTESIVPVVGSFYASPDYGDVKFNCFREEDTNIFNRISEINEDVENFILKDTNLSQIKYLPEYEEDKKPDTPTNKIISSLFTKERFIFILHYGFAYVKYTDKESIRHVEKHIMRYPQLFATFAIQKRLDSGIKKGIIWHTQGSGKTALSYYNVKALTDYFKKKGSSAKFYFIVDRIDLLEQACGEFEKRGLHFITIPSREEFVKNISQSGDDNKIGENEINVVNIQKFSSDSVAQKPAYNLDIQRVYFIDEAHRDYKQNGQFLANLVSSDRNAVFIALTGTPLIGDHVKSKDIFGNYIHTYYYNQSISDGFTLKLIREGVETKYRIEMKKILEQFEVVKGSIPKDELYSKPKFVKTMVEFIVDDFRKFRIVHDEKIGGMIVCDSAKQAREAYSQIQKYTDLKAALILHDEGTKEERKKQQAAFKKGEIDILIVFNMLLTGFDAPILKRLYMGRLIKEHSLLQALTRVNRPYKNFKFGYVVDFANIKDEFDKTNQAYFAELQSELGDAFKDYDKIFREQTDIEKEIERIQDILFDYTTFNKEIFQKEVNNKGNDKESRVELIKLRKALENYKELYNLVKLLGYSELQERMDIKQMQSLYSIVSKRLQMLNLQDNIGNSENKFAILNIAFDQIEFEFILLKEEELVIADKFRDILEKVRREFLRSMDVKDPEYVTLLDELNNLFIKKNIQEMDASNLNDNIIVLERLLQNVKKKNQDNETLCHKYNEDPKFMRIHKEIMRKSEDSPCYVLRKSQTKLRELLMLIKNKADDDIRNNNGVLKNEEYFRKHLGTITSDAFDELMMDWDPDEVSCLNKCISREYFAEMMLGAV